MVDVAIFWLTIVTYVGFYRVLFLRRVDLNFNIFYVKSFMAKALIVTLLLLFTSDKLASKEFLEVSSRGFTHNFFLYWLFAFPQIELLGVVRGSVAAVSFLSYFYLAKYITLYLIEHVDLNRPKLMFLIIFFMPDHLYFMSMSLRDPLVVFFTVLAAINIFDHRLPRRSLIIIVCSASIFSLRPEALLLLPIFYFASFVQHLNFVSRMAVIALSLIFLIFVFEILLRLAFQFTGIGKSYDGNIFDVIRIVSDLRYYRQFSDADASGSTSAIVAPHFYEKLTNTSLIFIQFLSVFWLSFYSNGLVLMFARFVGLVYLVPIAFARYLKAFKGFSGYIFYCSFSSILIFTPLLVNGGNIFRMRLTATYFLGILLAITVGKLKRA